MHVTAAELLTCLEELSTLNKHFSALLIISANELTIPKETHLELCKLWSRLHSVVDDAIMSNLREQLQQVSSYQKNSSREVSSQEHSAEN